MDAPKRARALDLVRQSDFGLSAQVLQVLEAKVLYTEDLSHGQHYGAVRAVNPFLEA